MQAYNGNVQGCGIMMAHESAQIINHWLPRSNQENGASFLRQQTYKGDHCQLVQHPLGPL